MNDAEFCVAYVNHLPMSHSIAVMHMRKIVQQRIAVKDMLGESGIQAAFNRNSVGAFVYTYIRDHQESFLQ